MGYRGNLGCLWLLLLIALLGGSPLLIGVLRLFLIFALAAGVCGWLLTLWLRRYAIDQYTAQRGEAHKRFVQLLVALLTRLAELDGQIDEREIRAIRRFFERNLGYRGEQLLWVRDLIKESRRSQRSIDSICDEIAGSFGLQERFIVIQVLGVVAEADGPMTAAEDGFVRQVAMRLGLAAFVGGFGFGGHAGTRSRPGDMGRADRVTEALSVLGVRRGASAAEIKQAWRKLSLENHPDRVSHLGEEFRTIAEQRMRRINAAYDVLKAEGLAA